LYQVSHLPLTHIGGAPVAFATRKDIAISSQFLEYPSHDLVNKLVDDTSNDEDIINKSRGKIVSNT
jgi:hypothetical protein